MSQGYTDKGQGRNASKGPKSRAKARSPLGGFIARFLDPSQDNRALASDLFGEERADSWFRSLAHLRFDGLEFGNNYHDDNATHIGRFFAWVCMVLERAGTNPTKVYCGRQLFQGQTKRWDKEARCVVNVPAHQAGGVAVRLGVCVRTVQAYAAAAQALGIIKRWQVTKWTEVKALPKKLRGKRYSYSFLQWVGEVPYRAKCHLAEWGVRSQPRDVPSARAQTALEAAPPPSMSQAALTAAAAFLAMAPDDGGPSNSS